MNRLHSEIIELTADEDFEDEIQQSDERKEKIYEALTCVNKALDTATVPTPAAIPTVATVPVYHGTKVKLPKITLPHFNGNLMKLPTF